MAERTFATADRSSPGSRVLEASRHLRDSLAGLALGLGVLALAAIVSGQAAGGPEPAVAPSAVTAPFVVPAAPASAAPVTAVAPPAIAPAPAAVAPPPATAVAAPVVAPAVPMTATPAPATSAIGVEAYRYGGKRYAGVRAEVGTTFIAPRAGTVHLRVYQLVDGDVRVGSNVPWLPFFPYVTLATADGTLVYRPGALKDDVTLRVADGDEVDADAALFTLVGDGASSWRTFYDAGASFNVMVSLVSPRGVDLDPTELIVAR